MCQYRTLYGTVLCRTAGNGAGVCAVVFTPEATKPMDFAAALQVLQTRSSTQSSSNLTSSGDGDLVGEPRCAECAAEGEALPALPSSSDPAELSVGARALVRRFMERQEERVGVYRRFEEGFLFFLQVAEADGYQALVKQMTGAFAVISAAVNKIENALRGRGAATLSLADLMRAVQGLEREKLQLTAQLHIVRHGLAIDALRMEHAAAAEDDGSGGGPTGEDMVDMRGGVAYAVGGTGGGGGARASALRTEEAHELARQLAGITSRVNETLEEIQCEVTDMDDEAADEPPS